MPVIVWSVCNDTSDSQIMGVPMNSKVNLEFCQFDICFPH